MNFPDTVRIVSPTDRLAALRAMPSFERAHYDPKQCRANRILLSDGNRPISSGAAAAYRMLRARLLQRARSNDWTIFGVTSPGPGDGKSVTTLNLALTIAREKNNNVFLIDLDMRNPKMCRYLGTRPPAEITEFFSGGKAPKDVLFSIGIDHLTLAGTLTPTDLSSELLASGRTEALFEYIRKVAVEPLILVDLPPILSTDDALVVAPKIDAMLLVVSERKTRRDGAAKALELLSDFNLAGIILNRSRGTVTDYYA